MPFSSASTSACRTASCTASVTAAESTRSTRRQHRPQFVNALTVPLNGTSFGVDFNPAADRLRIISDQGQNLAHNVNPGGVTVENGTLTYTAPPAAPVVALGLTGAAYTNNDFNQPATGTTLFDVDTTLDQIVIQSPPGNGILVATGKLGVDADAVAGFDIYSQLKTGVTASNHAFAALLAGGSWGFYRIELTTGNAVRLGTLGDSVVDIAIMLVAVAPERKPTRSLR